MKSPRSIAGVLVIYGALHVAFSSPVKDSQHPHVIKRRDRRGDYYLNEHLPLGYFINGADSGNNVGQQGAGVLASSSVNAAQPFARSGIPNKPKNFAVICEGEKRWVECKQDELIKIKKSFWGRDDHATCPKVPTGLTNDKLCETNRENTKEKMDGQCNDQQACEVVASSIFFDDNSCGNTYKYLKIWYECAPDEANVVDALRDGGKRRKRKRAAKEKRHAEMLREQEKHKRHV